MYLLLAYSPVNRTGSPLGFVVIVEVIVVQVVRNSSISISGVGVVGGGGSTVVVVVVVVVVYLTRHIRQKRHTRNPRWFSMPSQHVTFVFQIRLPLQ